MCAQTVFTKCWGTGTMATPPQRHDFLQYETLLRHAPVLEDERVEEATMAGNTQEFDFSTAR